MPPRMAPVVIFGDQLLCRLCQAYQPVTAPLAAFLMDQVNECHIGLTGGTAPRTQLDRQLQDAFRKPRAG